MFSSSSSSTSRVFLLGSLAIGLIASSIAIGCSDAPVEGSSENQVRDRPNAGQTRNDSNGSVSNTNDGGTPGKQPSSSSGGSPTKEKGDASAPPSQATPECLAECETGGLKAKCAQEGEDDFCDFACDVLSPEQRTCLTGTTSCSKQEWIACTPEPEDNGGGGGGDGKKK